MVDVMHRLYETLQKLKKPGQKLDGARWYVKQSMDGDWDGPFQAAEIAYQLYVGLIGPVDDVVNARTRRRYRIAQHRFLMQWTSHSADRERRLTRGLLRAVRELASLGSQGMGRRITDALSAEERKAFEVLELDPTCSPLEIRKRHRQLALAHHPDRGGNIQRMMEINKAFDIASKILAPA